jgi:soluble lytic murein transglycosylase-like protein
VTYLVSDSGDIGIMQVNRRVWRGFFDLEKLRWDIVYNTGAGAEILAQLLTRYGVREAGERLDNAARATYSAYNGGPGAYRRYRLARVPRKLRRIDEAFRQKYEAMAAGRAGAEVLCL